MSWNNGFLSLFLKDVDVCEVVSCQALFMSTAWAFFFKSFGAIIEPNVQITNCRLSVTLLSVCQPPLTSFINEPFLTTVLLLLSCPLGAEPIDTQARQRWAWKIQQYCSSVRAETILAPSITPCSKAHKSYFPHFLIQSKVTGARSL